MTAPAQPAPLAPPAQPATPSVINVRWIVSAAETLAFLAALILAILHNDQNALQVALGGAFAHGLIHF